MQVVNYPHPTLRHKSKPLQRVDAELRDLVRQMFDLMYKNNGIGLAANQVDLPVRLFIINLESDPKKAEELVFINPELSLPRGLSTKEEGCLSIPGVYGEVKRPERIRINAYNLQGEEFDRELDGLFARAVQHEVDHLDGVLFPDRMSETALDKIAEDLEEFEVDFASRLASGEQEPDDVVAARVAEFEKRYC